MNARILKVVVLAVFLAAGLACVIPVPQPSESPAPTPPPAEETGPVVTGTHAAVREVAAPERFTLNFNDGYLVYDPQTGVLQITAEGNVLSYGGDWQVHKVYSYLFHFRLKTWQSFYWQVNTSRLEVVEVRNGTFGAIAGGTHHEMPFHVDKTGGAGTSTPDRFTIRFPKSHMVYSPGDDVLQLITENKVLSYCGDWQRCKLHNNTYHFKQNNWAAFYWRVNTINKKVWRVRNGSFCGTGGTDELLGIKVGVTR